MSGENKIKAGLAALRAASSPAPDDDRDVGMTPSEDDAAMDTVEEANSAPSAPESVVLEAPSSDASPEVIPPDDTPASVEAGIASEGIAPLEETAPVVAIEPGHASPSVIVESFNADVGKPSPSREAPDPFASDLERERAIRADAEAKTLAEIAAEEDPVVQQDRLKEFRKLRDENAAFMAGMAAAMTAGTSGSAEASPVPGNAKPLLEDGARLKRNAIRAFKQTDCVVACGDDPLDDADEAPSAKALAGLKIPPRPHLWPVFMAWPNRNHLEALSHPSVTEEQVKAYFEEMEKMLGEMLERGVKINDWINKANPSFGRFGGKMIDANEKHRKKLSRDPYFGIQWAMLLDQHTAPDSMASVVTWGHMAAKTIDGGRVDVRENDISVKTVTPQSIELAIMEGKARGWSKFVMSGTAEFSRHAQEVARRENIHAEITERYGPMLMFSRKIVVMPVPPADPLQSLKVFAKRRIPDPNQDASDPSRQVGQSEQTIMPENVSPTAEPDGGSSKPRTAPKAPRQDEAGDPLDVLDDEQATDKKDALRRLADAATAEDDASPQGPS